MAGLFPQFEPPPPAPTFTTKTEIAFEDEREKPRGSEQDEDGRLQARDEKSCLATRFPVELGDRLMVGWLTLDQLVVFRTLYGDDVYCPQQENLPVWEGFWLKSGSNSKGKDCLAAPPPFGVGEQSQR